MHIASFQIENYKSFRETPEVALTTGFNVVVGQNNVGKTALVEALSLAAGDKPHRSLKSVPTPTSPVQTSSFLNVSFALTRKELIDLLREKGPFWVPTSGGVSAVQVLGLFDRVLRTDKSLLRCRFHSSDLLCAFLEGIGEHPGVSQAAQLRIVDADGNLELAIQGISTAPNISYRFDYVLASLLRGRVYAFRAERFNVGSHRFGATTLLRTDAANLPEVLDNLQGRNPERFARLNRLLGTVFPVIRRVTVRPQPNDQFELIVWTIDPATEREDLAVPLAESGTGIGQVLAMLYVVLTADTPRVILIDEPQSFLHPGAVRKLIEILRDFSQHQFLITTHSPTALTAAEPKTLLQLRVEEGETIIERLNIAEARDLGVVLAEVGARLSDVFGADNILWVEGRTEELCFPRILAHRGRPLLGTVVVGVLQTGDFEGRHARRTVEIYERLSAGRGLLPPAVAFVFDRKGRTPAEQEDLKRRGKVFFTPRRMYENYLIHPEGIAAVASGVADFREEPLAADDVRAWLDLNKWDKRYFETMPVDRPDAVWIQEVHGARLLSDLFAQFSENRVQYDKIEHGLLLTDWVLREAPAELAELGDLLEAALPAAARE